MRKELDIFHEVISAKNVVREHSDDSRVCFLKYLEAGDVLLKREGDGFVILVDEHFFAWALIHYAECLGTHIEEGCSLTDGRVGKLDRPAVEQHRY